ncbi:TetR/AcrR family transcriptional regulator [Eleftheria terrae]|uniref:TetR/AcrR family transcriptional regulator n=1 Tax=Eleftheria terrae TaxID=1597781 RepID=UPI00263B2D26|nr:TetR/AcrR family transcriptional regulator [Eleftheria terrae]WKB55485.1 TetR/AcrR family transcriptional regulator [Eleftheria terrae]
MNDTPAKRLPKTQRREQLIETAMAIVREEGTDALTLGRLAERAGVSKPIAYEHFKTRSGLLIALYKELDARQVAALLHALERTKPRLEDVARVVSRAYMHCYLELGPQWHAISAALKGDEQMDAFQQELIDGYVALYCDAFAPLVRLSRKALRLRCVAIIGAGEALAREMLQGRVEESAATAALASLIVAWLAGAA